MNNKIVGRKIEFEEAMKLLKQGVEVDWYHEQNEDVITLQIVDGELRQTVANWLGSVIEGVPAEMILEGQWAVIDGDSS